MESCILKESLIVIYLSSPPSDPIVAEPVGPEPPVDVNQDELAKSPEVEEEAGASGGGGWGGWANGWMDTGEN